MPLLGPSTDYTDLDFDALLARLRNLKRAAFPEWEDDDVADFGNILVELYAFVGDVLTRYQDAQAGEAFIGRATQRKNILALCKLLDFKPRGNTVSQADVELSLPAPRAHDVLLPARTRILTDSVVEPVAYETLEDVAIPAGQLGPVVVTAENAQQRDELFTATSMPNQEVRLSGAPFLDGSLHVEDAGGAFEVVDNFLNSTAADRHCTVLVDQDDRAMVRFGNGINGEIPTGTITAFYKLGGGSRGRVEAHKLRRVDGALVDDGGEAVSVIVDNPERSTLALDRQTIEEIRVQAPLSLRAPTRTVAREDFEVRAREVPGVARALMLSAPQDPSIQENTGILFIVPVGGGTPTQAMREAVHHRVTVEYPCTLTFQPSVLGAPYRTVDVHAVVHLAKGAPRATVRARIQLGLEAMFAIQLPDGTANESVDFGYYLRDDGDEGSFAWSDVFNVIRDTAGVRKVDAGPEGLLLNGERGDAYLGAREFPVLGAVVVVDAETSTPIPLDDAELAKLRGVSR